MDAGARLPEATCPSREIQAGIFMISGIPRPDTDIGVKEVVELTERGRTRVAGRDTPEGDGPDDVPPAAPSPCPTRD